MLPYAYRARALGTDGTTMLCMSALSPLTSLAASTLLAAEETNELPMPAWAIGGLALLTLLGLLMLTLSFGKGRDHT